jgi:iron complex transport system substrate-binding protein
MKIIKPVLYVLIITAMGCKQVSNESRKPEIDSLSIRQTIYAKGFTISLISNGFIIEVFNPWQGATNIKYRYAFMDETSEDELKGFDEVITFPVQRVVCLSTTHVAFIDLVGESEKIVGISGSELVSNPLVRVGFERGIVRDVGYEQSLNYELLVELKPDVVFSYGVGAESAGYLQKLKDLKIPVVFIADYLEESPLGKSEWVKVFGAIFGKYYESDSLFSEIEGEYLKVKEIVAGSENKPNVFINLPWQEAWYFPGNQSYMASLIEDAGGNYIFSNLTGNHSYPFSVEVALDKGMMADVWINTGTAQTLKNIALEFPRLTILPSYKNGKVFNNNNRTIPTGGNDFWESGVTSPHLILKDLVKIFYPDSLDHDLVYYKQLL